MSKVCRNLCENSDSYLTFRKGHKADCVSQRIASQFCCTRNWYKSKLC